ncbi:endonuclease [Defluviimonas sp. 20V17]|uniref:Endonuclease n=1 Tax=Allgaiera indica TaxID=765699 RepID=A0AAN4UR91_9RHOB|nr:endonuclease/exonuclease/phosphatase family protein [Allgaiera indica]KDB02446.1 endonuclease [Defluviimonas sp. 20V17]GHE02007.1 endonuclease [Allgaiera indica]SDX03323.1 Endonuclease/Exonuclease/phosphatase family protein [Allgaiera indica]
MRIATYNVEWFGNLFSADGRMLDDGGWSARYQVTRAQQLSALARVFAALDADAVMVIEAPDDNHRRSTVTQLQAFAAFAGLRARRAVIGFPSDTEQEIALLFDPDRISAEHAPMGAPTGKKGAPAGPNGAPRFDTVFRYDLDIDAAPEPITFSKPPLELAVTTRAGLSLRMIGVHAKSKAPHGARTPEQAVRIGIENRRKQLAQCVWLRARVDEVLDAGTPLMVMGDFNDGPGLDEYERLFGHSGIEVVLGLDADSSRRLIDPHAQMALSARMGAQPASARFYLVDQKRYFSALLDYIMLSPDLMSKRPAWRIWHPFDDPECWADTPLREALLAASDHFPVSVDLEI